jgi:hypothetical protein
VEASNRNEELQDDYESPLAEIVAEVMLAYKLSIEYLTGIPIPALMSLYEWGMYSKVRDLAVSPMPFPFKI